MRSIPKVLLLGMVVLAFGVAACGGDDDDEASETVTVTVTSAGEQDTTAADRGTIVNVELGESGSTYFVKPDRTTVEAGTVTFAVTNVGELYHELIVYTNVDGVAAGELPVNEEEDEADLVEDNIVGEAAYATPPIVPRTGSRGLQTIASAVEAGEPSSPSTSTPESTSCSATCRATTRRPSSTPHSPRSSVPPG